MLRITQSANSAGAKRYFDDALAQADYYLKDQPAIPSLWGGKGAERLGLSGEVTRDAFHALCDNLNPATGDRLTARTNKDRRVGYDFTFSPPKGVSVLHALGDARIGDAFAESVRETMSEIEAEIATRVRIGGKNDDRTTANMVWAAFTHTVSRPVDSVPDMHLHQHVYCFNATFDSVENRWKAGEFSKIKSEAPYWEAVFDSRLALKLRALGYGIERVVTNGKTSWDIARVPESVKAKFSRRTAEIEALADTLGIQTDALKATLGAKSREHKNPDMTTPELKAVWEGRLTGDERDALADAASGNGDGKKEKRVTEKEAVDHAMEHGLARSSVLPERELLRDALKYGIGAVSPEAVRDDVRRRVAAGDVLRQKRDGRSYVTTQAVLDEEAACIGFVRSGRGRCDPLGGWNQESEAGNQESGKTLLTEEQRRAVRHVLRSYDRVTAIRGGAGVGKTTLMSEAVAEIEARGHKVFTFAPSADASRGVLRAEGFANATTLAELLKNETLQDEVKGQVLWVDEAGMIGTKTLREVFDLADRQHCRVVLSGDTMQHGSVERGDAFRLLEEHAGMKTAIVLEIQRQKGKDYRDAVKELSRGDAGKGFDKLDAMGAVVEVTEGDERYKRLAGDYADALGRKESVLAVAPTHAEGDKVTDAIRSELKARGTVEGDDRAFLRLKNTQWTDAQKADAAQYRAGQIVQFTQNAKGFKAGDRFTVSEVEGGQVFVSSVAGTQTFVASDTSKTLPLDQGGRFNVYDLGTVGLAVGDAVRVTQNGKGTVNRRGVPAETLRLNNGALYKVAGFTKTGDIKLADAKGKTICTVGKEFGHIAHGYCATSHASQGKTVDHVLLAQSSASSKAASREQFYVSVSRGRKSARIYTDDKASLRDAVAGSGARISATELMGKRPKAQVLDFIKRGMEVARLKYYAEAVARNAQALAIGHAIPKRGRGAPEPERSL